jgi:putative integral membrane protein (TIGR02587 family)
VVGGQASGTQPKQLAKGVGRGFGGAVLFALPLFMTLEMWHLGFSIDRWRLGLLLVAAALLAFGLESYFSTRNGREHGVAAQVVDTGIALLTGLAAAAVILASLAVIEPLRSWREALSIVTIEGLMGTIGASFARSQLGAASGGGGGQPTYRQELFLMSAGAVVFATTIAPTEEVILLGADMRPGHGLALVVLELILMHAFVYGVDFKGGSQSGEGFWKVLVVFTLVGYVIALVISAYLLWTFGRFEDTGLMQSVMQTVVLALPASVGAAAAWLIL